MSLKKEIVDMFIVETILIEPISKIIDKLNAEEFRDCDIIWLDNKLEKLIKFAAETLGIILPSQVYRTPFTVMNDYNKKYYLDRFSNLLNYFKNL